MKRRIVAVVLFAVCATPQIARAADPRYPDWPCSQAKVPEVSLAAVWSGPPLDDIAGQWKDDPKVSALVARISARRTPLDEATKAIDEFLSGATDKTRLGKLLFSGVFDTLNAQRTSVMTGLERITRKQREAAEKIRNDSVALQAMQSDPSHDQAKLDELGNQVGWETRIFEDRSRVIKFVCEVPTAIDQRLFALGRSIQQDIE